MKNVFLCAALTLVSISSQAQSKEDILFPVFRRTHAEVVLHIACEISRR